MARGLFVHTSNRLEELLEALATVLADEPLPPLQDDVVAVPSQGAIQVAASDLPR